MQTTMEQRADLDSAAHPSLTPPRFARNLVLPNEIMRPWDP